MIWNVDCNSIYLFSYEWWFISLFWLHVSALCSCMGTSLQPGAMEHRLRLDDSLIMWMCRGVGSLTPSWWGCFGHFAQPLHDAVGFRFRSVRFCRRLGIFSILFLDLAGAAETSLGGSSLAAKGVLSWSEIQSFFGSRQEALNWLDIETCWKEMGKSGVAIKACRRNSGVKPRTGHLIRHCCLHWIQQKVLKCGLERNVAQLLISSYDFDHGSMQMEIISTWMFLDQKGSMKQLPVLRLPAMVSPLRFEEASHWSTCLWRLFVFDVGEWCRENAWKPNFFFNTLYLLLWFKHFIMAIFDRLFTLGDPPLEIPK